MCQQTSAVFSCGHKTVQPQPCATATRLRTSKGFCDTIATYPPRQRSDPCLACWANQAGLVEVSDNTKGRDDLPPTHKNCYPPAHHNRRLFRSSASSGDLLKDAETLHWRTQGHRYDPERKKWAAQRSRMRDVKPKKQQSGQKAVPVPVLAAKKKTATTSKQQAPQPKAKAGAKAKGKQ